jgi:hypothetical protein
MPIAESIRRIQEVLTLRDDVHEKDNSLKLPTSNNAKPKKALKRIHMQKGKFTVTEEK